MAVTASVAAAPLLTAAPGALSPPRAAPAGQRAVPSTPSTNDRADLAADSGRIKSTIGQAEPLQIDELELGDPAKAAQNGRSTGNEVRDFFRSPNPKHRSPQPGGEELRRLIGVRDDRKKNLPAPVGNAKKPMTWTDTWSELDQSFQSDRELLEVFRKSDSLDDMLASYERRVLEVASNRKAAALAQPEFIPITAYVAPDAKPFFKGTQKFGGLPGSNAGQFGNGPFFASSLPKSGLMSTQPTVKKSEKKRRTTNVFVALAEFIVFVAREIYNQVWARVLILLAMFAMTARFFQMLGRRR